MNLYSTLNTQTKYLLLTNTSSPTTADYQLWLTIFLLIVSLGVQVIFFRTQKQTRSIVTEVLDEKLKQIEQTFSTINKSINSDVVTQELFEKKLTAIESRLNAVESNQKIQDMFIPSSIEKINNRLERIEIKSSELDARCKVQESFIPTQLERANTRLEALENRISEYNSKHKVQESLLPVTQKIIEEKLNTFTNRVEINEKRILELENNTNKSEKFLAKKFRDY